MTYIAFRWLTALAITMWLSLCCFDTYLKEYKKNITSDFSVKANVAHLKYRNGSVATKMTFQAKETPKWQRLKQNYNRHSMALLHYIMYLAGAFVVLLFSKRNAFLVYMNHGVINIKIRKTIKCMAETIKVINLKSSAKLLGVALNKYLNILWGIIQDLIPKVKTLKKCDEVEMVNLKLLERVKEIGQDRKTLGKLLIAAIAENKNIRFQYQLETMAKNRLVQYIENTQKLIKENRTRYVSFQQLYIVTHRENIFLKNRVEKLINEKNEAEKNLMELISEVYRSQNNNTLKAYCTRFIVHTKKNLLKSDVRAEIQEFLRKSRERSVVSKKPLGFKLCGTSSLPECSFHVTDIVETDDSLAKLVSDAPKLRGLPGECVWTVKDKNGIIEKLYEYNYETDYDNGDTIRKIREYSVYYDKDCLLDQTNLLPSITACPSISASVSRLRLDPKPMQKSQRFLTNSKEFQSFLSNSPNNTSPRVTPLPCA